MLIFVSRGWGFRKGAGLSRVVGGGGGGKTWVVGGEALYLYPEQTLTLSILPYSWQQSQQALSKGLHTVAQTVNNQVHQPKDLHSHTTTLRN